MAYINEINNTTHGDSVIFLDINQIQRERIIQLEHIRTLGVMGLHQSVLKLGLPCTTMHWASYWNTDDAITYITKWLNSVGGKRPIFGFSNLFGLDIFGDGAPHTDNIVLAKKIKEHFPDSKIIVGGPNPVCITEPHVKLDGLFYGRALWLMERWLQDKSIPTANQDVNEFGIPIFFNPVAVVPEDPIVPDLHPDYCLSEEDVLTFETRLGCKFDCTFCGYEFRGNKDPHNANEDNVLAYLEEAKSYGITRFSIVDDTFNEDKSKLDLMLNVVRQLDYQPRIAGFNRFDILVGKRDTIDVLDEIGFHGHLWGIETFHPEASKKIKKTARPDRFFKTLELIRDEYPHWWVTGSMIVGIPPETSEHSIEMAKRYIGDKLFSAINAHPLFLRKFSEGISDSQADFTRNPEKYGLYLTGKEDPNDHFSDWASEYGSYKEANTCADRIQKLAITNGVTPISPWTAISKDAIGHKLFSKAGKEQFTKNVIEHNADGFNRQYFTDLFLQDFKTIIANYVVRKLNYVETL